MAGVAVVPALSLHVHIGRALVVVVGRAADSVGCPAARAVSIEELVQAELDGWSGDAEAVDVVARVGVQALSVSYDVRESRRRIEKCLGSEIAVEESREMESCVRMVVRGSG